MSKEASWQAITNEMAEWEAEQMITADEWEEAKMFGQYEQRENREEVVVFRRVDLCAYVTMLRQEYAEKCGK